MKIGTFRGEVDFDGGPGYLMIRGSYALQVTMPCFSLWTKHKEMANEHHDGIQKSFPDVDKNVDSNNIEKFTLPNESCGSEITHIFASFYTLLTPQYLVSILYQ